MYLSLLPHSLLIGVRNPIVTAYTVISGVEGVKEAQREREIPTSEREQKKD